MVDKTRKHKRKINVMNRNLVSRREFLKRIGYTTGGVLALANMPISGSNFIQNAEADIISHVFYAKEGTPDQNISKCFQIMGGIGGYIGGDDVVILKPNAQWIRQGGTNTSSMKALIDMILAIPGFTGEIIIAENNHVTDPESSSRMWGTTDFRFNGPYSFNTLLQYYRDNRGSYPAIHDHGGEINVSKYVLKDSNRGGRATQGPSDGDGYVRRTDLQYFSPSGGWEYDQNLSYPSTIMTYPIFTSTHSGITVDLKNGCWQNGNYIDSRCVLIMMAGLNFHSSYAGSTSAVKNYYGVVELPGGFNGQYSDFHRIGFPAGGGAVGSFVRDIRRADLFVTTAEWCGHQGRSDMSPVNTKTILASTDPLALDYYAFKNVMYPLGGRHQQLNNPDDTSGPLRKFLNLYRDEVDWGTLNEAETLVQGYDFSNPTVTRSEIDAKIAEFKNGQATEEEVHQLIQQYNNGE
ncbi:MAG: DUF362 domain-containing protein [candidate division Zixibacteria bacterium]|nr:DUF362 domain-containing protein [candidate division Zixibacteria bacterium]